MGADSIALGQVFHKHRAPLVGHTLIWCWETGMVLSGMAKGC